MAESALFAQVPLGACPSDHVVIRDAVRARSVGELADRVARTANWLRTLGPVGSSVAVVSANRVEVVETVLGAIVAGMWVTPVNARLTAEEVAFVVADSAARVVLCDDEHRARASATGTTLCGFGDELDEVLADADDRPPALDGPPGGTMIYTSGTTGRPKGVRRAGRATAADHLVGLSKQGHLLGLAGTGAHLVTGPLSHAAPLGFALMDLCNGAPVVLMERWDAAGALELLTRHEAHTAHLVPTMFVRLLRLDAETRAHFDPSHLRTVLHGAAPISRTVKQAMLDWWGPVLVEYWGGSEGGVVTLADSAEWLGHPGTVGRPISGHDVFAVGDDGEALGANEVGVLYARHPAGGRVFNYHGDPAKTETAHRGPGEYTLGDIGYVDHDGYVHLVDRAAETIISGGVNIYPVEVEQVLAEHPAIADVAVVGAPDPEWGEQVVAVVELEAGPTAHSFASESGFAVLTDELDALAREHLAGYKVPRRYERASALPRQPNGKLYRREVRARFWDEHDRSI